MYVREGAVLPIILCLIHGLAVAVAVVMDGGHHPIITISMMCALLSDLQDEERRYRAQCVSVQRGSVCVCVSGHASSSTDSVLAGQRYPFRLQCPPQACLDPHQQTERLKREMGRKRRRGEMWRNGGGEREWDKRGGTERRVDVVREFKIERYRTGVVREYSSVCLIIHSIHMCGLIYCSMFISQ
jgi:hypothetical protein